MVEIFGDGNAFLCHCAAYTVLFAGIMGASKGDWQRDALAGRGKIAAGVHERTADLDT